MTLIKGSKKIAYLSMIGLLFIIGCSSGDESATLPSININESNQKQVLAVLFDSIDNATPQLPLDTNTSSSDMPQLPSSQLLSNHQAAISVKNDVTENCSDGGMIYTSEDDGKSIISYEDCQEAGTTTNGEVSVSYDESTQVVTYILTDYTLKTDDKEYMTSLTSYKLSAGHIAYSSTGKMTFDGETTEFNKYDYTLDIVDNKLNISVNGSVKTTSLGGWVSIKTDKAIQISDTCPTVGEVEVRGNSSKLKVQFKSDASLDVYLNSTLIDQYADCNNLPDSSMTGI